MSRDQELISNKTRMKKYGDRRTGDRHKRR
jgi:hypothetical protein